jgi:hypothetical protein
MHSVAVVILMACSMNYSYAFELPTSVPLQTHSDFAYPRPLLNCKTRATHTAQEEAFIEKLGSLEAWNLGSLSKTLYSGLYHPTRVT